MAIAIQPTAPVTGKQAKDLLLSMKTRKNDGRDVLSFDVDLKEIKRRLKKSRGQ